MENYCLMTFKSITFVMQFEKIIKEHNINVKIIPVPRAISTSCGMCAKIDAQDKEKVMNVCKETNIHYNEVYDY